MINDSRDCAALVNLNGLLSATKVAGTNEVDTTAVDLVKTGVVTFVKISSPASPAFHKVSAKEAARMAK